MMYIPQSLRFNVGDWVVHKTASFSMDYQITQVVFSGLGHTWNYLGRWDGSPIEFVFMDYELEPAP